MLNETRRASAVNVGKFVRWPGLYSTAKPIIIAPIDDFLIFGPFGGLENRRARLAAIIDAGVDVILTYPGAVERNFDILSGTPFVLNLTASTVRSQHTHKEPIASVERAVSLGAIGVAAHVNLSSSWAPTMIRQAGDIVEAAAKFGIPSLGIIYPRGENGDEDENYERLQLEDPAAYGRAVGHCVSLGVDLGFDIIKTQPTASRENFSLAIDASDGVPVVVAGGPLVDDEALLHRTGNAFAAGAAGVSYGRNFFGRTNLSEIVEKTRSLYKKHGRPDAAE